MNAERERLVAVFLGTDHHPFPRLVSWVEDHLDDRRTSWFVQHGSTPRPPAVPGAPLLSADVMSDMLARADAVVMHAGPGLIMDAIGAGHRPLVVPRRAHLGEHVDDHQMRFARRMTDSGAVVAIDDIADLDAALDTVLRQGRTGRETVGPRPGQRATVQRFGALVDELVRGA